MLNIRILVHSIQVKNTRYEIYTNAYSTKDIENEEDISLTQSWSWKIIIKNLGLIEDEEII